MDDRALAEAVEIIEKLDAIERGQRLHNTYWTPFDHSKPVGSDNIGPYQWQIEFHNMGADHVERALIAANRVGKTQCGSAEMCYHLTGLYPDWWKGRVFSRPISAWVGSDTNETSRDIVQKALIGDPVGEGWIPKELIRNVKQRQAGISDVADTVKVKHTSGRDSTLMFKTYEQGRKKWQGTKLDIVWFDEEPPQEIFTEGITRTFDAGGMIYMTFTPLSGANEVVMHFLDGGDGIYVLNVTWDDAPHLDGPEKQRLLMSYPAHERDTRAKGIPMVGSGVIFPTPDEELYIDPIPNGIPNHYRRVCGIDFGIDHPFAAVWVAYDADTDTAIVYDCYKAAGQTASYHASAINKRGDWIPVAWPHDGLQRDKAGGVALATAYRKEGLRMLGLSARHLDKTGGAQPLEPGILDMDDRMRTGRLKVYSHLTEWFREKRMYHRKDGQVVQKNDDLMSATRYALMMLRFARPYGEAERQLPKQAPAYDPFMLG